MTLSTRAARPGTGPKIRTVIKLAWHATVRYIQLREYARAFWRGKFENARDGRRSREDLLYQTSLMCVTPDSQTAVE